MMESRKIANALLVFALVTGTAAARAEDRSKEDAIRELIEITGMTAMVDQLVQQVAPTLMQDTWKHLKKAYPLAPDHLFAMIEEEMLSSFHRAIPEMIDGTVAIYAKYFTVSEIDELNLLYRSELGRKLIRVMPGLVVELTKFGYLWGHDIVGPRASKRVQEKLRQEGYEL